MAAATSDGNTANLVLEPGAAAGAAAASTAAAAASASE